MVNVLLFLMAAGFTCAAGRELFPNNRATFLICAVVMGFGPWSCFGSTLLGPGSLAALLWAVWLWGGAITLRSKNQALLPWLALLTFAMSSVGVDGLVAAIKRLRADEEARRVMGQRGRSTLVEKYQRHVQSTLTRASSSSWWSSGGRHEGRSHRRDRVFGRPRREAPC